MALFNVAIDSKLRGCDVVALKVEDVAPNGYAFGYSPGPGKYIECHELTSGCSFDKVIARRFKVP